MVRTVTVAAALAAALTACGGGGGGNGGPAGVDRNQQISAVTAADKDALCDWFAPMVGGYGATPACADALLSAPPSKADCIATFPSCAVPVGQFQDCVVAVVAAQQTCTEASLSDVIARADCQAVGRAGCFDSGDDD